MLSLRECIIFNLAIIISVGPIENCKFQMEFTRSQEARDSRRTKCGTKWVHAIFYYNWARSQCLRFWSIWSWSMQDSFFGYYVGIR